MEKFQITKEGYHKLKAEIDDLKNNQRPAIIKAIAAARELGDLKENADYHASKDKQGMIEAQIADLDDKFSRAEIIDLAQLSGDTVKFGATVTLENLDNERLVKYKLVSEYESDIDQNLISSTSPLARAITNKSVGDQVEINTPNGVIDYEIVKIEWA